MNENNFEPLRSLISLKRHEQPDDAYFEELLEEFHRRQRQNHLNPSFHKEITERVAAWFAATNRWNYVAGVGAAYALVFTAVILFWPKQETLKSTEQITPAAYTQPVAEEPESAEQKEDKDAEPSPEPAPQTF